jgi:hypothetical protein
VSEASVKRLQSLLGVLVAVLGVIALTRAARRADFTLVVHRRRRHEPASGRYPDTTP